MNAKNKKLMVDVEDAIGDYAYECKLDGQYNVPWNADTSKAHTKLWALLLELEKALP